MCAATACGHGDRDLPIVAASASTWSDEADNAPPLSAFALLAASCTPLKYYSCLLLCVCVCLCHIVDNPLVGEGGAIILHSDDTWLQTKY